MSGPSDRAVEAAYEAFEAVNVMPRQMPDPGNPQPSTAMQRVVILSEALHDDALGLDRSVCVRDFLRDVVEELREVSGTATANHIERKFGVER